MLKKYLYLALLGILVLTTGCDYNVQTVSAPAMNKYNLLGHVIARVAVLMPAELERRFRIAGHQLDVKEFAILNRLNDYGELTIDDISEKLLTDKNIVVKFIKNLESTGLVVSLAANNNQCSSCIALTEKGREVRSLLLPISQEIISDALAGADPADIAANTRVLNIMEQNLSKFGTE